MAISETSSSRWRRKGRGLPEVVDSVNKVPGWGMEGVADVVHETESQEVGGRAFEPGLWDHLSRESTYRPLEEHTDPQLTMAPLSFAVAS